MLFSVFLFVFVKRSTFKLKLSRISKFKKIANKFDEFVIFTKKINRSVQSSSSFAETFLYERETSKYIVKVQYVVFLAWKTTLVQIVFIVV